MRKHRKVEDELEARVLLAKVSKAVEVGAWARAHGIDGRSLNAWRMNLARRGRPASRSARPIVGSPRLVELVPAPVSTTALARYRVRVGDAEVELGDDFQADTLRRLLEVLRGC